MARHLLIAAEFAAVNAENGLIVLKERTIASNGRHRLNHWMGYRQRLLRFAIAILMGLGMLFPVAEASPLEANVVYLGEIHDSAADHQKELSYLQTLYQESPQIAIGLEMFQRPFQSTLDQYMAGEIDADALRSQSEFDQRWGYDWNDYAPILAFAKEKKIPVLALNTPVEVTWKVGQSGLDSLQQEDQKWIPPLDELDLSNQAYRDRVQSSYDTFHKGQGNSTNFEHFYQAQILWDETMAEAIANYVNAHPERHFVTLVGSAHVMFNEGIPNRVKSRIRLPHFHQTAIQLSHNGTES